MAPVTVGSIVNETLFITLNGSKQHDWENVVPNNINNNIMTIGATTFSTSNFRAYFDIRTGGVQGSIVNDPNLFPNPDDRYVELSSSGTKWINQKPDNAFTINEINYLLNGNDESGDFWPGEIIHSGPHPVFPSIPEPSTFVMAALGVFGLGFVHRRRRSTVS